jgi:F-type H+-transporting ATPase subunit epsilon
MADTFSFDLVSPARLLASEEAEMVVVPGGDGDFGILPGHAPLLSTVRPGVLDIYENDAVRDRVFIAGGFAEVADGRLTVLAEEAMAVSDIDRAEAEARLEKARQAVDESAEDSAERRAAEAEFAAAEAMVAAAPGG